MQRCTMEFKQLSVIPSQVKMTFWYANNDFLLVKYLWFLKLDITLWYFLLIIKGKNKIAFYEK